MLQRETETHISNFWIQNRKPKNMNFFLVIFIVFHAFIDTLYKMIPFKIATGFIKTEVQK